MDYDTQMTIVHLRREVEKLNGTVKQLVEVLTRSNELKEAELKLLCGNGQKGGTYARRDEAYR